MTVIEKNERWLHKYTVEQLPGLPATEPPMQFSATSARVPREGLVVRVQTQSLTWLGNFQRGDAGLEGIAYTPSPDHLCIIARGYGYWVSASAPETFEVMPVYPVVHIATLDNPVLMVLCDYTKLAAYGANGRKWLSADISWDGIKLQHIDSVVIRGLAWDSPNEKEVEFAVDTLTGRTLSGPEPPPMRSLRLV